MIRKLRKTGIFCALLALGACGKVGDLEPRAGETMPPVAYGQHDKQSAESLMEPSPQARPTRSDELVKRSAAREEDPFDFAPGQPVPPFPGKEEEEGKKATDSKAADDNTKSEAPK